MSELQATVKIDYYGELYVLCELLSRGGHRSLRDMYCASSIRFTAPLIIQRPGLLKDLLSHLQRHEDNEVVIHTILAIVKTGPYFYSGTITAKLVQAYGIIINSDLAQKIVSTQSFSEKFDITNHWFPAGKSIEAWARYPMDPCAAKAALRLPWEIFSASLIRIGKKAVRLFAAQPSTGEYEYFCEIVGPDKVLMLKMTMTRSFWLRLGYSLKALRYALNKYPIEPWFDTDDQYREAFEDTGYMFVTAWNFHSCVGTPSDFRFWYNEIYIPFCRWRDMPTRTSKAEFLQRMPYKFDTPFRHYFDRGRLDTLLPVMTELHQVNKNLSIAESTVVYIVKGAKPETRNTLRAVLNFYRRILGCKFNQITYKAFGAAKLNTNDFLEDLSDKPRSRIVHREGWEGLRRRKRKCRDALNAANEEMGNKKAKSGQGP